MDVISAISESVDIYGVYVILGLFVWCLIITILALGNSRKVKLLARKQSRKLEEGNLTDISAAFEEIADKIGALDVNIGELIRTQRETDRHLRSCIQRYGMVRYDAFADVGGEQSFSLALLDEQGNGVVLSNIYGRQDSRMYVRQMNEGICDKPLSNEEKIAVETALGTEKKREHASVQ